MSEFSKNLWAPWRMQYIRSIEESFREGGCFLCDYWRQPESDVENHVLWRGPSTFAVMNRFPYTNGHLLIANGPHQGDMGSLSDDELSNLSRFIRDGIRVLSRAIKPHGFNVGYNLGRCAGAGLPDHIHAHIVPRWNGDTNYMAVISDIRVIPDSLTSLYQELIAAARLEGLLGGGSS